MIIRCPSCGSTYDISKQPQAAGRKVKCMRCSHVWKAEPVDAAQVAPAAAKQRLEPAVAPAPPPPAPSEITFARPPIAARSLEPRSEPAAETDDFGTGLPDDRSPTASRTSNGLNGAYQGNGYAAEDRLTVQPPPVAAVRRTTDFDVEPTRPRRTSATSPPDSEYYVEAAPQRPAARRQEPQWREPPQESYRDDTYGDHERDGYGQDDFSPRRDARPARDQRTSRGRRAAAIVGWVAYLAAMGGLFAYAYAGRDQVVAWLPGAAPYYAQLGMPANQFGLEFRGVKAAWGKAAGGQAELSITVGVENVSSQAVKVPTVVIAFRDANGDEMFFRAMADALPKTLQAGKSAKFSATLQVPAQATRALQVRFASGL